MEIDPYVN